MSTLSLFLRSLVITGIISFMTPWFVTGIGFTVLLLVSYIPLWNEFAREGMHAAVEILAVFGNGSPVEGLVAIGLTYSLVNMLFEAVATQRYQKW